MRILRNLYQSNFSAKTRVAAIIIKKSVPFIHKQTVRDRNGSFLVVPWEINSLPITLVNVYGPHFDDP